jgi:hypothetical protein
VNLIVAARRKKVKIISSMGAGGKLDVSKIKIADIDIKIKLIIYLFLNQPFSITQETNSDSLLRICFFFLLLRLGI